MMRDRDLRQYHMAGEYGSGGGEYAPDVPEEEKGTETAEPWEQLALQLLTDLQGTKAFEALPADLQDRAIALVRGAPSTARTSNAEASEERTRAWKAPRPEGYIDAIQLAGSSAAPIIAGFSVAIVAIVLQPPRPGDVEWLRWRDAALALFTFASIVLVVSTQAALNARSTAVRPDELSVWYPQHVSNGLPISRWLASRQVRLLEHSLRASVVCRHTYNLGLLTFFVGLAVLLVPPGDVSGARQIVLLTAIAGVIVEAAWATGSALWQKARVHRLPALLVPSMGASVAVFLLITSGHAELNGPAAAALAVASASTATATLRLCLARSRDVESLALEGTLALGVMIAIIAIVLLLTQGGSSRGVELTYVAAAIMVGGLGWAVLPRSRIANPGDEG